MCLKHHKHACYGREILFWGTELGQVLMVGYSTLLSFCLLEFIHSKFYHSSTNQKPSGDKLDFSFIFKLSYINILPTQNSNTKNPTKTTDWFYMMEMKRNLKSYRNHTIKSKNTISINSRQEGTQREGQVRTLSFLVTE